MDGEQMSKCFTMPTGMVVLTASQYDIDRGYLIGPDGQDFLLSPKNRVGYQFTYRPQPKEGDITLDERNGSCRGRASASGGPLTHEG